MRARRVARGVGLVLMVAAGCTPITAREAQRRSAGWGSLPEPSVLAPGELMQETAALPDPQRAAVSAALGLVGTSDQQLDCSGLVRRAYAAAGVALPRTVSEQLEWGEPVLPQDLQPGDLVFFAFHRRSADHVGVYAGRGQLVHVSSSAGCVQLVPISSPSFAAAQVAARRPATGRRALDPHPGT